MKQWSPDDQPREKLERRGASALTEAELLAILLRTGTKELNVLECCRHLLVDNDNNLNNISQLSIDQLSRYEGIGKVKAITILAAIELGKRRALQEWSEKVQINSAADAFAILQPMLCDLDHEEVWVLLLNNQHRVLAKRCISRGGMTASVIDVRIIMRYALQEAATALILSHNHPSGAVFPSRQDILITDKIKQACGLLDIEFIDHIIVCHGQKYSFAENGKLS